MSNEATIPKRGRPPGSNSFVRMRLSHLAALLGESAVVPVSKVWLKENGINTEETLKPVTVAEAPEPVVEQPRIEYALTSFDEEEVD